MSFWACFLGFIAPDLQGTISHSLQLFPDDIKRKPQAMLDKSNSAIRAKNRVDVLEFLKDGEATAPEIAAGVELSEKTTRLVLHDLLAEYPPRIVMTKPNRVSVFSLVKPDHVRIPS